MKTETILNRPDGSKVKISCLFNYNNTGYNYKITVETCEPKKRTFKRIDVTDEYEYRKLPFGGHERANYEMERILQHVTNKELSDAKIKTWESLKPII